MTIKTNIQLENMLSVSEIVCLDVILWYVQTWFTALVAIQMTGITPKTIKSIVNISIKFAIALIFVSYFRKKLKQFEKK